MPDKRRPQRLSLRMFLLVSLTIVFGGQIGLPGLTSGSVHAQHLITPTKDELFKDDEPWNGLGVGIHIKNHTFANQYYTHQGPQGSVSFRFVAEKSGPVRGSRHWVKNNCGTRYEGTDTGYARGDGGRIRVDLHEDDGHGSPGRKLATGTTLSNTNDCELIPHAGPNNHNRFPELAFVDETLPSVVSGEVYHLVFHQEIDEPNRGVSVNMVLDRGHDQNRDISEIGLAPVWGNTMAMLRWTNGRWEPRPGFIPLFSLIYEDGTERGPNIFQGDTAVPAVIDGNNKIRMVYTPTTDRTVRFVYAGLYKNNEEDHDVYVALKTMRGDVLADATLKGSDIGYLPIDQISESYRYNPSSPRHKAPWVKAELSETVTLQANLFYYLELSAPEGADIRVTPLQDSTAIYPFDDPRYKEARSAFSTDGGIRWSPALHRGGQSFNWVVYPLLLHFDDTSPSNRDCKCKVPPLSQQYPLDPDQLILNGSFEEIDNNWLDQAGHERVESDFVYVDYSVARSGDSSVHLDGESGRAFTVSSDMTRGLEAGGDYEFSVWYRAPELLDQGLPRIPFRAFISLVRGPHVSWDEVEYETLDESHYTTKSGGGNRFLLIRPRATIRQDPDDLEDWNQLAVRFTLPSDGGTTDLLIRLEMDQAAHRQHSVWIDDLSLRRL